MGRSRHGRCRRSAPASPATGSSAGGAHAVSDLQLEIAEGEFLVLVGPSGCGKSTALRMVAGLEKISAGRILIGDRVVNNVAPMSRDIAMVFQSSMLRRGDFVLEVPERFLPAVQSRARELLVGIRPEHLEPIDEGAPAQHVRLPAVVEVVEYLGDEQLVHLRAGDVEIVAKVSVDSRLVPGDSVTLGTPLGKLYLFDRATNDAIVV